MECVPSTGEIRICDLHNRYRFGKVPTSAGANHTHTKLTGPPPGRARLRQKDRGQTYKEPVRQLLNPAFEEVECPWLRSAFLLGHGPHVLRPGASASHIDINRHINIYTKRNIYIYIYILSTEHA